MPSPMSSDFKKHSVVYSKSKMPTFGRNSEGIINVNTFNYHHDFTKQYDKRANTPLANNEEFLFEAKTPVSRSGVRSKRPKMLAAAKSFQY
jgi:hypothetical protein